MERDLLIRLFEISLRTFAIRARSIFNSIPYFRILVSCISYTYKLDFLMRTIFRTIIWSYYEYMKTGSSVNDRSDIIAINTVFYRCYRVWPITRIRAFLSILSVALTLSILSRVPLSLCGYLRGRELTLHRQVLGNRRDNG